MSLKQRRMFSKEKKKKRELGSYLRYSRYYKHTLNLGVTQAITPRTLGGIINCFFTYDRTFTSATAYTVN